MSLDLSVVTQKTSSPPRKIMLVSLTPVEDALFDQNDKLGRVCVECFKYKDVVVDLTSSDFEGTFRGLVGNIDATYYVGNILETVMLP